MLILSQKGRLVSFKVTSSNDRVLCVYPPSANSWLGGVSLKGYIIIWGEKKGNENKIILGDFNCTMDKMDRDGGNKTQRLYRFCSNYAESKLIVDNGLKDLWRSENPDS